MSFSAQAQTQQLNHYWTYFHPSTNTIRSVIPVTGSTEEQYFQQALLATVKAVDAQSCESIFISYNDPTTGNATGPSISNSFDGGISYTYPVKGLKCPGYYNWNVSLTVRDIKITLSNGPTKTVCGPGSFAYFDSNSAVCKKSDTTVVQSKSTGGVSLLPVADSDCFVCKPGLNKNSGYVGDPIHLATGNVFESSIDYQGVGSNKIRLSRHYNSIPGIASSSAFNVGSNWVLSYDRRIEKTSNGAAVSNGDGGYIYFIKTGTNTYAPQLAGRKEILTFISDTGAVGWKLRRENGDLETYSPWMYGGYLTTIDFMQGGGIDILGAGTGTITGVSDRNGHTIQFTRTSGRISKVTLPDGSNISYNYDSYNRLTSVVYPDGSSKVYEYAAPLLVGGVASPFIGNLIRIQDQDGLTVSTFTYDNSGSATSSSGPMDYQKVSLSYGADSTQVTNSLGLTETHEFYSPTGIIKQANKRTTSCTNCFANAVVLNTTHDSNGNITSSADKDGRLSCSTYDTGRNLITSKVIGLIDGIHTCGGSYGSTPVLAYNWYWHPTYAVPLAFSEPNKVTVITRDANLRPLAITEYATNDSTGLSGIPSASTLSSMPSRTFSYSYLTTGEVTSIKSARSDVNATTSFTYDNNRNLTSITTPTGLVTTFGNYNTLGLPGLITQPNGATINLAYDYAGRILQSNYAGAVTSYSYTPAGRVLSKTEPNGLSYSFGYDAAGRLVQVSDNTGNSIQYVLDSEGNVLTQKIIGQGGALAGIATSTYNGLSRLMSIAKGQ